MLNKVVEVKVLAPHVLRIAFKDGYSAAHDFTAMSQTLTNAGEPLRDPDYFARVFLDYGALTWPNGYDMCPDWLREEMAKRIETASPAAAE